MERRCDRGRSSTPVVAGYSEALETEGVGEVDEVLPDRSLLRHARRSGIAKACWPITAKIRHQHPVSSLDQWRRYIVPSVYVVGKAMQKDDWETLAAVLVPDIEHRGLNLLCSRWRGLCARVASYYEAGQRTTEKRSSSACHVKQSGESRGCQ
jgi:hypothetical protein